MGALEKEIWVKVGRHDKINIEEENKFLKKVDVEKEKVKMSLTKK